MKIKELYLQNFRSFSVAHIKFDPFLTVIVGENGIGKTSILDAIAIAFGRLLTKLPKIKGVSFKDTDLRMLENEKRSPFVHYWIHVNGFSGEYIQWSNGKKRDSSDKTIKEIISSILDLERFNAGYKQIDKFADSLIDKHNGNEGYSMPVIAYYGTNRAILDEVQRRRNFRKEYSRFESLVSALNPNAGFKEVFEWFNAMEDMERRKQMEYKNFGYTLPELNAVRKAIESMLPGFSRPRTEIRPLRFVIDRTLDDGSKLTLRIGQLSDGYRVMLGLVMDLARRLAQANPPYEYDTGVGRDSTDPLDSPAIVLIDEVDLHLHPKWQQRVLGDLRRTFRNTQFIVTTHSPQVLTTIPSECIRILKDNQIYSAPPGTEGAEPERMLKQVLGVHEVRPPANPATQELKEYLALVDKDQWNSPHALELREKLNARYQGNEPALLEADLRIENRKWELGI
ncbi:AAA family ATPase [Candidatus Symbiobacter mobilis]|uniref:ATPase-like protein n=1 Tax=Candidatus Symbiobacter mobilis CR TaxID=946483 RepID=U5NEQ9_9BURK|nr:AAA family ATPase [Candidatus Symbiobacter mobilis]AGX88649.1 ATPase-like protein [Candidatus Symbiobacter mobilis CR]